MSGDEDSPTDSGINEPIGEHIEHMATRSLTEGHEDIDDDEDEDLDETLVERLIGLSEMFPQPVRNGCIGLATGAVDGVKVVWIQSFGPLGALHFIGGSVRTISS